MILPIVAFGDPVLRKKAENIEQGTDLTELVANMFQTMYAANGVGLAAPQIGKAIRLFVVDAEAMDEVNLKGFKKVFINPTVIEEKGDAFSYEEGCLSIPGIRLDVSRKSIVVISYFDEHWNQHTDTFEGLAARVIQHEYDHLEGVLFTDYASPLRKQLIKGKLSDISKGITKADYRMKFPAR